MLTVTQVDLQDKRQVHRFIEFPYTLYAGCPQWVPPLRRDVRVVLDPQRHPFYEHSEADFFLAERGGEVVGRIAALENRPFNRYHQTQKASFYLFECVDDLEVARALFERVIDWARKRHLNELVGPKGFGVLDGYGLLVEGFEHRQMMTMMNYNYPYYPRLLEGMGFQKEVDFVSCYLNVATFRMPERIHRIAQRVLQRGSLKVKRFESARELRRWTERIRKAYNRAFVNNWEYYPISQREAEFLMENAIALTDPRLIKLIVHGDELVGFLFGFPDVSAALQRARGRLTPWALVDLLREMRRTEWVALNGAGLIPDFHGVGGNALLYSEMEKTVRERNFKHADLTQVAETAVQMRHDLENVGGQMYKNHRVYRLSL